MGISGLLIIVGLISMVWTTPDIPSFGKLALTGAIIFAFSLVAWLTTHME